MCVCVSNVSQIVSIKLMSDVRAILSSILVAAKETKVMKSSPLCLNLMFAVLIVLSFCSLGATSHGAKGFPSLWLSGRLFAWLFITWAIPLCCVAKK